MQSSWDAHNNNRDTHCFEGAWGAALDGNRDQSGRSLPYIDTEALGSKSPNWSATRSPAAEGVLWHKESYGSSSPDQVVQEGFTWLCIGVWITQDS